MERLPYIWLFYLIKTEMVKILIGYSENVNIVDEDGKTPLHLSAQNNNKEIVDALIRAKANVNIKDKDGKTPFDLTTDEEIKALLKKATENPDDVNPVDESSTDSKGGQEEDAGTQQKEKQEDNAQPGSDIIGQDSDNTEPQSDNNKKEEEKTNTISAEKGTDIKAEGVKAVAPIEPAQTEEQPSSFFGSLFSILTKPFSLIASFFGGFFSWLFGSNEEKIDESTSQTDARCEGESSSCDYDATRIDE